MLFLFTSGCIPIPIPRNFVVQPELHIQVLDDEKKYISNAQVFFVTLSDPHNHVDRYITFETDEKGSLYIPEKREFEWIFPLMMHGIPFYNSHICIYKNGYIHQSIDLVSQDKNLVITLAKEEEFNKEKTASEETATPCSQYKDEYIRNP